MEENFLGCWICLAFIKVEREANNGALTVSRKVFDFEEWIKKKYKPWQRQAN